MAVFLGHCNVVCDDAVDNAGGISMFWLPSTNLLVSGSTRNYFVCNISDVKDGRMNIWKLILLYGSPYNQFRREI